MGRSRSQTLRVVATAVFAGSLALVPSQAAVRGSVIAQPAPALSNADGIASVGSLAASAAAPDFTFVVLPDTQLYSGYYPATFTAQTNWIVSSRASLNTVFVSHLGDVVNTTSNGFEWQNATKSMAVLDAAAVPYGLNRGNHDGPADFDAAFPLSKYAGKSWFGGSMAGKGFRDSYELFAVGALQFIVLHVEYAPPPDVLAWASGVLKANAGRRAIVATHDYLLSTGTYSPAGTTIWNSVVRSNCNVFLVVSGHASGEASRRDPDACGNPVEQVLTDYQGRPNGGNGWLRYYTFHPSTNSVDARTYSPTLGQTETDGNSAFSFAYDMTVAPPAPEPPPPPPSPAVQFVTGSALGNTTVGAFTTATKIQKLGGYITWRLDGGIAAANQTISIWVARKTSMYGTWTAWYRLTSRRADARGVAYANIRTGNVQWISLRPVLGNVWGRSSIGRWIR